MENVKALLDTVVDMAGLDLGATLAGLVTGLDLMGQPVPALAQNALDTLVHDTNVTEDHDLSLEASATVPSNPDDDPDQDVVDKSGLQTVIDQAEVLELAGASQAALDKYYAALAAALRVMSDPNATEAQVAQARADLAAAIEAVEKSQSAQGGGSGDGGQGGNASSGNAGGGSQSGTGNAGGSGSGGTLPQTGDASNMAAVTAAAVLGGAALAAGIGARVTGGSEE